MLHWWVWYTSITVDLPLYLCRHACCTSSPPVIKRGPTISYVNKDCTRQCARPLVQRENSYCFSSYVLQSHNCNSPLMRVLSVEFLISSHLRCASLSAYGYRLCSTCISSLQDHLQIPHLPSGKMPGPDRTWTETAKHLLSRPRR